MASPAGASKSHLIPMKPSNSRLSISSPTSSSPPPPPTSSSAVISVAHSSSSIGSNSGSNSISSSTSSTRENVKVVCRVRPPNSREIKEGGVQCVKLQQTSIEVTTEESGAVNFTFDRVFGQDSTQHSVFEYSALPLVADVLNGYNATIFAYGQTGTGKTHTMEGNIHSADLKGIIPRSVEALFLGVADADDEIEFVFKVSYVEIYLEKIRDLLDSSRTKTNLNIREDKLKGIYIADVTEEYVASHEELLAIMGAGAKNRATAATGMNEGSSRSHSVFTITVTQKHDITNSVKSGKLVLVDLAGSEMVRKTNASGQQLEEAKMINKSLSALGQVINALTDEKQSHIPYRDSKLTRILQDSLGGNSKTVLIIAVSPSSFNAAETVSTCRFGMRAKSIQNKATINQSRSAAELEILLARAEESISLLTGKLVAWEKGGESGVIRESTIPPTGYASTATSTSSSNSNSNSAASATDTSLPASSSSSTVASTTPTTPTTPTNSSNNNNITNIPNSSSNESNNSDVLELMRLQALFGNSDSSNSNGVSMALNSIEKGVDSEFQPTIIDGDNTEKLKETVAITTTTTTTAAAKDGDENKTTGVQSHASNNLILLDPEKIKEVERKNKDKFEKQERLIDELSTKIRELEGHLEEDAVFFEENEVEVEGYKCKISDHEKLLKEAAEMLFELQSRVEQSRDKCDAINLEKQDIMDELKSARDQFSDQLANVRYDLLESEMTIAKLKLENEQMRIDLSIGSVDDDQSIITRRRSMEPMMDSRISQSSSANTTSGDSSHSRHADGSLGHKINIDLHKGQFNALIAEFAVEIDASDRIWSLVETVIVQYESLSSSAFDKIDALECSKSDIIKRLKVAEMEKLRLETELGNANDKLQYSEKGEHSSSSSYPSSKLDVSNNKGMQHRLEQLVTSQKALLLKFTTVELELADAKKKLQIRDRRLLELEKNASDRDSETQLQAERHVAELVNLREQIQLLRADHHQRVLEQQMDNSSRSESNFFSLGGGGRSTSRSSSFKSVRGGGSKKKSLEESLSDSISNFSNNINSIFSSSSSGTSKGLGFTSGSLFGSSTSNNNNNSGSAGNNSSSNSNSNSSSNNDSSNNSSSITGDLSKQFLNFFGKK